jgi:hypothetical protein
VEALIETSLEPRKEWANPELRKIDIAILTADGPFIGNDIVVGALAS